MGGTALAHRTQPKYYRTADRKKLLLTRSAHRVTRRDPHGPDLSPADTTTVVRGQAQSRTRLYLSSEHAVSTPPLQAFSNNACAFSALCGTPEPLA